MIVYDNITWSSKEEGDNDCDNCSRSKLVDDWKNTRPQGIFLQQKNSDLKHNSNFEKNSYTK